MNTLAFIGAGNVSASLAPAFKKSGLKINQIYSRTYEHAKKLADSVEAQAVHDMAVINADFIIISVPDNNIEEIAAQLSGNSSVVIHTSGSTNINVLKPYLKNYGVLYPLQTFSKSNPVKDFSEVPVFIEADSQKTLGMIKELAGNISGKVTGLDSEKRMGLHISAVFSCNFFNSMLSAAFEICNKYGIDPQYLKPLVEETLNKAFESGDPAKVQTGPAVRGDTVTTEKHMNLLKYDRELQKIYSLISEHISNNRKNE